ncbi:stellacyanin [Ricinus communis]|uniref:Stellacyanin, putative n=1 Tax=Ricinus communis TaxID=3988 RepID=B9RYS5_RICCO|nr:stellacyanin [Ricinus communis]EEF43427.1 Stellacyanin, putative [Ricinus communis]|eukprot:XP_002518894.1 stellacyanin [Ricinus communis]
MANLRSPKFMVLYAFQLIFLVHFQVSCYQYKVGDLDAWGIPTSANPKVYIFWSKYHTFKIGDSLLFLYPPSQDSVIQVTEQNYNSCNLTDPVLYMKNGNSLFNITANGHFYFTSGVPGHCEKKQKLHISVGNDSDISPSNGSSALPDTAAAPSYPTNFGTIPLPPSASSPTYRFSIFFSAVIGAVISAYINGIM